MLTWDCGGLETESNVVLDLMPQVKTKGSRRISFEQFLTALSMVADTKKASLETIVSQVRTTKPHISA